MAVVRKALASDPKWLKLAFEDKGQKEIPGKRDNPVIMAYYKDVGHGWVEDDEVAWCAAFVGSCLQRAGEPYLKSLTARSYLSWGSKTTNPKRGDIVVFKRGSSSWQGHVGFFLGFSDDKKYVYVLDGNASNSVKVSRRAVGGRNKVLGYRTPTALSNSRTLKASLGGATAGTVALVSEGAEQVREGLVMTGWDWAIIVAGVIVIGMVVWAWKARRDDWKRKGV